MPLADEGKGDALKGHPDANWQPHRAIVHSFRPFAISNSSFLSLSVISALPTHSAPNGDHITDSFVTFLGAESEFPGFDPSKFLCVSESGFSRIGRRLSLSARPCVTM